MLIKFHINFCSSEQCDSLVLYKMQIIGIILANMELNAYFCTNKLFGI